jgi:SAM-dependent methyltransferase
MDGAGEPRAVKTFEFEGFLIPEDLAILTGGGEDSWVSISRAHMAAYARYCPVRSGQSILEIGCGVGRDAIPLLHVLGPEGSYVGVDIIGPSISWCQANITPRYPNAAFAHLDIRSNFYNPSGQASLLETRLPIEDGSIDLIILQSVFTHMFEDDIVHYLSEFRRVLRPNGSVFASFFIVDSESLGRTATRGDELTFQHRWGNGCRISDPRNPEGAVGYTPRALHRMLRRSGMQLDQPVHHGWWSGRENALDGQDIAILKRSPRVSWWANRGGVRRPPLVVRGSGPWADRQRQHRRRALRSLLSRLEPVDQALRRLRRSREVAALQAEVASLRAELAAQGGSPGAKRFLTWVAPGHFYSPVPDQVEIDRDADRLFSPRRSLTGVDLREGEQLSLFGELARLARGAPLPTEPNGTSRYWTENENYGVGDALVFQSMLRHLRPRRYLEVGSGWTTALALDTSERFLDGELSVTAVEPYPDLLRARLRDGDRVEILETPVQSVPLARFQELEANDVLFIDSSHVLKTGSDVHFLYTSVLPVLAEGVYVHLHDMFWPFEYLRHWIEEGRAWNELYLVHAFLLFNDTYQVVLFNTWLADQHRELIQKELPAMLENPGGALWLRRGSSPRAA